MSSPHQYLVRVPPRSAYSHSASVGNRKFVFVAWVSHAMNCWASLKLTLVTGASSFSSVATEAQALAATHWPRARTVSNDLLMANGLIETLWIGPSERSRLLPIPTAPPGRMPISGSNMHSGGGTA